MISSGMALKFIRNITAIWLILLTSATVAADWREELGTFRIGMLADPGSERVVAGLAEIRHAFSIALGMPVQIFVARDYAALIDAQATSRVEYAIYSAMAYGTARRLCDCVEPLAAKQGEMLDTGIRSVLILRKQASQSDADINKARIAVTQGDGLTGAIIPSMALSGADGPPGVGSSQLVIAASDSDAESMFLSGKVDGLFGWVKSQREAIIQSPSGTIARLEEAGLPAQDLDIHWTSEFLPYGPHTVRKDLSEEAKSLLRQFLTGLAESKPDIHELLAGSGSVALLEVSQGDYRFVYEIVDRYAGQ
ncbi:MAG: PhnD/SsuA/transferrin family substrate-binding protein [Rhizobiaceae bacterium]